MPELPEVTTIVDQLRSNILGREIVKVDVLDDDLIKFPPVSQFATELKDQRLVHARRRAKYILIEVSSGKYLVFHLMLTGQLLLVDPKEPVRKHTKLILDLDNGQQLRLHDSRGFAKAWLATAEELNTVLHLDELGPEPLSDEFTPQQFARMIDSRGTRIKPLLLDQKFIAGIGNIYSDEALFASRINPETPARDLTPEEIQSLYRSIRSILKDAIAHHGTTTQAYRGLFGQKGQYQNELKVHSRAGKPCPGCPGTVVRKEVGGRETYFCPSCQRLPKAKAAA